MSNDTNNISATNNENSEREKLLQQLNEDLFSEDAAADEQFEDDANIGLQQIEKDKIPFIVDKLNTDLHRHLKKKKQRKGIFKDPSNIYITIITILLLIVIAYIIIRKSSHSPSFPKNTNTQVDDKKSIN
jgi:hypothetical protein